MNIIEIKTKEELNAFAGGQPHSQFLQSWQWGEFHKNVSGNVWRLGIMEEEKLAAVATIIEKALPAGKKYFYCPRGPIINYQLSRLPSALSQANGGQAIINYQLILETLFSEIKKIAEGERAMFLRFDPTFTIKDWPATISQTIDVQPSQTLILDLAKTESELLKQMHPKTRYNIKLAEKKGVKVYEAGMAKFEEFWRLLDITGERDYFRLHGRDYYKTMLSLDEDFIKLFVAEYRKKIIAANIISFFGDTATYMHGASANENRNIMAPHKLQWEVIKEAKKKGHKYYDFYGINEKKWPGVTKFKKGFGGEEIIYPGTFDLVFDQNWYSIYKMIRKVRRTF